MPEKETTEVRARILTTLHTKAKQRAAKDRQSLNDVVVIALEQYLKAGAK